MANAMPFLFDGHFGDEIRYARSNGDQLTSRREPAETPLP